MLKVLLQETTEIKASLKTTLEEPSSRNKNKGNEIIFGSISFPEKPIPYNFSEAEKQFIC
ncbi:hypothetical protein Avbf_15694 [Armadillidium vulgare]|nr:hypothetical protein Avbf_15694 [Armadillidium vulgare]